MPPSIFLSYASEDRAAARRLRDALVEAGLEVWYDENELVGGDAWDQKIRRQIRECTYFMPLISGATERRREGYFRREWRLATERTLDMADDLMFLLPVAIDDTRDDLARVPEKFCAVQWLRCPAGEPTPALSALAQRLLAGDTAPPPLPASRPPSRQRGRARTRGAPSAESEGPPPMPAFPQPQPHHRLKYFAEVLWWGIGAVLLLYRRLPRWMRGIVLLWLVFTLIGTLRSSRSDEPDRSERDEQSLSIAMPAQPKRIESSEASGTTTTAAPVDIDDDTRRQLETVAAQLEQTASEDPNSVTGRFARASSQFVRKLANASAASASGRRLVILPFNALTPDPVAAKAIEPVFNSLFGRTAISLGTDLGLLTADGVTDESTALASAIHAHDRFALFGRGTVGADQAVTLHLRLVATNDGHEVWAADYPISSETTEAIAQKISEALQTQLPL